MGAGRGKLRYYALNVISATNLRLVWPLPTAILASAIYKWLLPIAKCLFKSDSSWGFFSVAVFFLSSKSVP